MGKKSYIHLKYAHDIAGFQRIRDTFLMFMQQFFLYFPFPSEQSILLTLCL